MKDGKHLVIGWRENISLPEWDVEGLVAKADTGAKSSAIDVVSIKELSNDRVRFKIALCRKDRNSTKTVETKISRRVHVRSSNGQTGERLMVKTALKIGALKKKDVEFGLVCRKNMLCRALLGRKALEDDFLVDSEHTFLFSQKPRKKKKR